MQVFTTLNSFLAYRKTISSNLSIGFVPTMGALHEGHGSLVKKSVEQNDITIVSIFVNPTQFAPNEDFDAYPRTLERDAELLGELGVTAIFAPQVKDIYPAEKAKILFRIEGLVEVLCGKSRPGHMEGVLQVVSILFHLVRPQYAYFGEKDYQQYMIIRQMVEELHFPLEVVPCPIIREEDGLAKSSRNAYLNEAERKDSLCLYNTIQWMRNHWKDYDNVQDLLTMAQKKIQVSDLVKVDYIDLRSKADLRDIDQLSQADEAQIFIAAHVGNTRLIDNMSLT